MLTPSVRQVRHGVTYECDKFCFLASLVLLIARAFPQFVDKLKLVGNTNESDESKNSKLLREFSRIFEDLTLSEKSEFVGIDGLGVLLSETIPSSLQDPCKVWDALKGLVPGYVSVLGEGCSMCFTCGRWLEFSTDHQEIQISVSRFSRNKSLQDLLDEAVSKTEEFEYFDCTFHGCDAKQNRGEAEGVTGDRRKWWKRVTGVRVVTLVTSPPVLVLILKYTHSAEYVELKVEESLDFNGAKYALMGIQRHEGRAIDPDHWTTVVRDESHPKSTWTSYQGTKICKVKACEVSSNSAVALICHKLL